MGKYTEFSLAKDIPFIHNSMELKAWLRETYILTDYMTDYDTYNDFMARIMNLLRASFTIKSCREYPISFKFNPKEKQTHELELRHFIVNMILWFPFVELNDLNVLDETFIIDCTKDIPSIENFINNKVITTLRDHHLSSTTVNYDTSILLYNLRRISIDFSLIMGLNFSIVTFLDMYKNNEEVRNMMEVTFDEKLQPYEVEQQLAKMQAREIEIYKNDMSNPIGAIFRAGSGIKNKQFTEFTISEGFIPSLEGVTIPKVIENSTLIRGLDRPSYLYIGATGARKSLVLNKKVMGKAGHFGKIVLLLACTLTMSTEISDCGTNHLVEYEVKSKKHLKKLNGKYFKRKLTDYTTKLLNSNKDKDLIGEKIYVRSAATCALGDCVCSKCIGITASTNYDIADGISGFESEEVTKVVNQSILSTKHLLTTNSEVIAFNKEFYNFFVILGGEINPIVNDNQDVPNIEDYAIYIDPEDLVKLEEQDYDSLFNTCIQNGRFYIRNIVDDTAEDILIQAEGEKEIFLTEDALELMKKGKGLIHFSDLDDDYKLFEMVILNRELTEPLYRLMELLNKQKSSDDASETIDSMTNKFLDLLIESGIDANVIAAELIINRLIRSIKNPYDRPDFTAEKLEPYEIYTVQRALEHNKSPFVGLSFQNIKRQFLSDELYTERTGTSYLDPFYWEKIPTSNLVEYTKLAREENAKDKQHLF